ncbi:hypothetical protein [Planktotalea arctica]|uniref:DUF7742 family protein n=1 Tax=Planktotalea arctica TaxID=1481893 RepID=UPI00111C5276|nr:hypothetical protein [Planktotalea arctica]
MRAAFTLGDLVLAARYLMRFERAVRAEKCAELLCQLEQARDFAAVTGRAHALLGDGSLGALALRRGIAPMPASLTPKVMEALELVLGQLKQVQTLDRSSARM